MWDALNAENPYENDWFAGTLTLENAHAPELLPWGGAHLRIEMTAGEQILDFIHVDDISRFLIYVILNHSSFCMLEKNGEDFHLGTGRGTTVREVAKIIESVSKRRCNINWGARAYRDRDTMYAVAPIAKNIELIQWKAQIELKVGIERYLNKR